MTSARALDFGGARWYRNQITYTSTLPRREASYDHADLPSPLADHLASQGIRLYGHQVDAIRALRSDKDVILSTPTASGKTLAFNLPVIESLLEDPLSTALYLYPLKALANDQLTVLRDLEQTCGLDLRPSTYDGDTPVGQRAGIKRTARIVLTNPYALHQYLPWHHQWARLFSNLSTVVIDEAHYYRGVFGASVAHLLQRLLRIVAHYGAHPRIVLSSASIGNPLEFGRSLTGREPVVVSRSTAEQGERTLAFWDTHLDPSRSITSQAAHLLRHLTDRNVRTLCFVRSRAMAEAVSSSATRLGGEGILAYRAGYLPDHRRMIESDLREGRINGVVSTSALEAGIDIGGLDAAILVGFPGSLLSAWQQAGRVGRRGAPSLVIYMPYEDPLDRYYLHHPEAYLEGGSEQLVIPLANQQTRAGHLACAAAELPLAKASLSSEDLSLAESLEDAGLLAQTPHGFIYRGLERAHDVLQLGDLGGDTVRLVCEGKTLETLDDLRARRTAFPGAVMVHQGETLVIDELDLERNLAIAHRENVDYRTHSLRSSEIEILGVEQHMDAGILGLSRGHVEVTESFRGYKAIHSDRTIDVLPLELPDHSFETDALWMTWRQAPAIPADALAGALHGAEHALIAMASVIVLCDPDDIGGVSTQLHLQTRAPTILIHDSLSGGSGIADTLYTDLGPLVARALALVADCPCTEGCPSCLLSPRCGSQNQPLSKTGARAVLGQLHEALHHLKGAS